MSILELQAAQQTLDVQKLIARMGQIKDSLLSQTPSLPDALLDIHKMIASQEDMVHLLSDDDIAMLHQSHERWKQVHLVAKQEKKITGKKKLDNKQLDML